MKLYLRIFACVLAVLACAGCGSGPALKKEGLSALERKDYKTAVKQLEKACLKMPEDATVFCNLGVAYWRLGRLDDAVEVLEDASRLKADDPRPLEFLGWIYVEKGDWAKAKKTFAMAGECSPKSPRILTAKAVVEINAGEVKYAAAYLTEALQYDPDYPPALYNLGALLRDHTKNVEKTAAYFKRYLEVADDDYHAATAREFLDSLSRAAKKEPVQELPGFDATMASARAEIEKEQYDAALVILKDLAKKFPNDPNVMWEMARVYDKYLEYPEKAEALYAEFKKIFPDDSRINSIVADKPGEKADKKSETGDKPDESAVQPAPQDVPGSEGQPVAEDGGKTAVVADGPVPEQEDKPVVEVDVASASEAFSRGNGFLSGGKVQESIAEYEKALKYNPKFVNAALNLGIACKEAGDLGKARHSFEYTLSLDPGVVKAHYMLGVIYYDKEMKDINKAIRHVVAAVEINPDYAKAHYLLGLLWASKEKDRPDLAKEHFERCIKLVHAEDPLGKRAKEHLSKLNL